MRTTKDMRTVDQKAKQLVEYFQLCKYFGFTCIFPISLVLQS